MINVVFQGRPLQSFKTFILRRGNRYFLRLMTVVFYQNSRGNVNAEGLYKALFEVVRHPGQIELWIFIGNRTVVSVIGKPFPTFEVIKNDSE